MVASTGTLLQNLGGRNQLGPQSKSNNNSTGNNPFHASSNSTQSKNALGSGSMTAR